MAIPLGGEQWALAQTLPVEGEVGVIDRVFHQLPTPDAVDTTADKPAIIAYVLGTGFDENGWVVVGEAPFVDAFRKRVVRWRPIVARPGFMVGEMDPFDAGVGDEHYVEVLPTVADPSSPEHQGIALPLQVASYLQDRWGLPKHPLPNNVEPVSRSPRDELLDYASVAELQEDSELDPKRARSLLERSARSALSTVGFLDAELGAPALAAACATKDPKMARAFRTTAKSMARLVPDAKAVAARGLDRETSELAQLHEESGSLEALVTYVEGLGLE